MKPIKRPIHNLSLRRSGDWHLLPILYFLLLCSLSLSFLSCGDSSTGPTTSSQNSDWPNATPESQGFDASILDTLTSRVEAGSLGRITSILLVRNGYLIYEEYFRNQDKDDLVNTYSCTKSVASALTGIAIGQGAIGGVGDRLFDYLGSYELFPYQLEQDSLYRESLTLRHMLTMTAGFRWDEFTTPYGDTANYYTKMVRSSDYIQFTLSQPIVNQPGTEFEYNTGLSGLMGAILERATGQPLERYARRYLFGPIGIDTCEWRVTPGGIPMTGSGLKLRPRDMARIGWLCAQDGSWNGNPVIPAAWVQQMHQAHVDFGGGRGYGYQWWIAPYSDDQENPMPIPYALGYGGQHILVVSHYNTVIVVTADDDDEVSGAHIVEILGLLSDAFTP